MRGNANKSKPDHMSIAHHWVGVCLYILVIFQVVNGFQRPPIEPGESDENTVVPNGVSLSLPSTKRGRWRLLHMLTAFIIIWVVLYQLLSGLRLYSVTFGSGSNTPLIVLGSWIALLTLVIAACWCYNKQQQQAMVAQSTFGIESKYGGPPKTILMPQHDEEDTFDQDEDVEEEMHDNSGRIMINVT